MPATFGSTSRIGTKAKCTSPTFVELTEWVKDDELKYRLFGKDDGVTVEKIEPLLYRVTFGARASCSS